MKSKNWRWQGNELKYVQEVLENGFGGSTTGSMNQRLEEAFAKRFGVKYAITSNSGTSTLHQALLAAGVGVGDEVIVPALAPIMCALPILHVGATPIFADVLPQTFLLDPSDVERKLTPKTKAIIAVHTYGLVCDLEAIMALAKKHNLLVIEDCAQCFLGTDSRGRLGGTIGQVGSFSFQLSKHLSSGEGGMLITNDEVLAERMRKFGGLGFKHIRADRRMVTKNRDLVQDPAYLRHDVLGYNYRMSELTAAVALGQLEKLDDLVAKRQAMAGCYENVIQETNCSWLMPQVVLSGYKHSYFTWVVKYLGEEKWGASWYDFRKKYMELGGDGIYAAWALIYNEPIMSQLSVEKKWLKPVCLVAEELQPKLLHFTTNQADGEERAKQAEVLRQTIEFFHGR